MRSGMRMAAVLALALLTTAQAPAGFDDEIDKIFASYDRPGTPGCAVGIVRDGKLTFARGYGFANIEHDIPLTPKTVFDIGSTSKQFTATAILLLEQLGRLSIDDDVRKYVPELPAYGHRVTIRHLLNHTSGIRDYLTLMSVVGVNFDGVATDDDALRIIVRQRALNFEPGSEHLYSNSGYFLLSVIVRRASGKSLREFAQEHIFEPLEMHDTHFHDDHRMPVRGRATGYAPGPYGTFRIDMSGFEQTGDGAVYTTVEDLAKWDRNFNDPRVGGRRLVEALTRRGILNDGTPIDYGAGLVNATYRGLSIVNHGGAWAGYRAELIRFPGQALSVICLCNRADGNPGTKARQIADVYLASELAPVRSAAHAAIELPADPVRLQPELLQERVGIYRSPTSGALRRIELSESGLRVGQQHLIPLDRDRFVLESAQLETLYVFAPTASGQQLTIVRAGTPLETLVQLHPPALTPPEMARLEGIYYSEELDTTVRIEAERGRLVYVGAADTSRPPLEPLARNLFTNGTWQLEFTRTASGSADGFLLHAGRIRGLRFERR